MLKFSVSIRHSEGLISLKEHYTHLQRLERGFHSFVFHEGLCHLGGRLVKQIFYLEEEKKKISKSKITPLAEN